MPQSDCSGIQRESEAEEADPGTFYSMLKFNLEEIKKRVGLGGKGGQKGPS